MRLRAAQVLIDLGPVAKFAVPALREQLKEEKNSVNRVKLAEALWIIDKPPARSLLPVLLEALADKDATARANAANVLGQLGSGARSAVPALAKLLQDKELTVRIATALALGEMGPAAKEAVPALVDTLRSDDVFLLEPFVVGTLGKIGEDAVPFLKTGLTAKEPSLRRGAVYALALIGAGAADAVEPLGQMLADPDAELRAQSARTLGKIGKAARSTVPLLSKLLADKEYLPRIEAAVALWRVDNVSGGLPVLVLAMKHESVKVREQACMGLGELSGSKLVPVAPLRDGLKDSAPTVRALAAETLGNIGSPAAEALPALREAFKDNSAFVRVQAATAVWRIDRQAADVLPVLTLWLGDKDQLLRKTAAAALGAMGADARAAWDALLVLYRDDPVFQVQRAAGIALRQIDLKAAVKAGVR